MYIIKKEEGGMSEVQCNYIISDFGFYMRRSRIHFYMIIYNVWYLLIVYELWLFYNVSQGNQNIPLKNCYINCAMMNKTPGHLELAPYLISSNCLCVCKSGGSYMVAEHS